MFTHAFIFIVIVYYYYYILYIYYYDRFPSEWQFPDEVPRAIGVQVYMTTMFTPHIYCTIYYTIYIHYLGPYIIHRNQRENFIY